MSLSGNSGARSISRPPKPQPTSTNSTRAGGSSETSLELEGEEKKLGYSVDQSIDVGHDGLRALRVRPAAPSEEQEEKRERDSLLQIVVREDIGMRALSVPLFLSGSAGCQSQRGGDGRATRVAGSPAEAPSCPCLRASWDAAGSLRAQREVGACASSCCAWRLGGLVVAEEEMAGGFSKLHLLVERVRHFRARPYRSSRNSLQSHRQSRHAFKLRSIRLLHFIDSLATGGR